MVVCRNINSNDPYLYLSGNRWRNLRTGVEGEIPDETAKKVFKINLELTHFLAENPLVEDLIRCLNLKVDK